jgi:hypothetical protein
MRRLCVPRLRRAAPRAAVVSTAIALLAPGHATADGKYSTFGPYSTWAAAGLTGQCAKTDGSGHFVQADNFTVYPLNGICEDVQGAWVRVPADGDKSWAYYCDSGSRPRMLNQSVEFDHWTLATSGVGFSPNSPSPSADVFDIDVHNWNTVFGDAWHYRGLYACVRYTVAGQPGYGGTQRGDFYSPNGGPDPMAMQNGFSVLCQSGPGVSIYDLCPGTLDVDANLGPFQLQSGAGTSGRRARAAARPRAIRPHVGTTVHRPPGAVRVPSERRRVVSEWPVLPGGRGTRTLSCPRGLRLLGSREAVGYYSRRPPSRRAGVRLTRRERGNAVRVGWRATRSVPRGGLTHVQAQLRCGTR